MDSQGRYGDCKTREGAVAQDVCHHFYKHGVIMLKRIILGLAVGIVTLMPLTAYAFNDKMLILHKGQTMCVDWWAWPGHMLKHGDTLVGTGSCDVPKTGN